jgi:DGQHR domain-containing protein
MASNKTIKVDAIKIEYNDTIFYVAVLKVSQLFRISEVSRADEDPEQGYQRLLGKQRAKKISEYISAGNVIPGSIILSAQAGVCTYDTATKKLSLNNKKGSLLVIDGQHRLYGAHQYEEQEDIPLPVCIFDGLDKAHEVQYFLDINGYQRGVPKTLQIELTKFTADPESKEDVLNRLFNKLESDSPLTGKLTRTKSMVGKLSHVSFRKGVEPILEKAPMHTLSFNNKVDILTNYLAALETILLEEDGHSKRISNGAFFQAIMGVFIDACNMALYRFKNYKRESFEEILSGIADINFDQYKGTNNKAISELTGIIRDAISSKTKISDDLF